ncbi:MAG TPA: hypothetical protein VFS21_37170 [Roseiflexaceae bacterium]|nr:hypothetical protein [Roseiflexaceae bacterium]
MKATEATQEIPEAPEYIVIVEDYKVRVPTGTDIEKVREFLKGTYPQIGTATVNWGEQIIDGLKYKTVEFRKKSGTKGATGADLLGLLHRIPPMRAQALVRGEAELLDQLIDGKLTVGEALARNVITVLNAMPTNNLSTSDGDQLCNKLDQLVPVAGDGVSAW